MTRTAFFSALPTGHGTTIWFIIVRSSFYSVMNPEIVTQLREVFRNVFHDDEIDISPVTTAEDVEGWDSLMHVTLIVAVEKSFGVRFLSGQVAGLKNVGELVALIEKLKAEGQ